MDKKVKEIVINKTPESNWLDYKYDEYKVSNKSRCNLLKEVIGMLNSNESYKKDKFIIMGVIDDSIHIKGIEKLRDDNEYQNEFDNINPRPIIQKGQISIGDKIVSFLYISANNIDRPYTIKNELNLGEYSLSIGASFIRKSTVNYPLQDDERALMIFKTMNLRKGKTKLANQIASRIFLKSSEHMDEKLSGFRTINPSHNNGEFIFGNNEYLFVLKLQVASNDLGRIYVDTDKLRIGKISNRDNLIETFNLSNDDIDFSSRVVSIYPGEIGVSINEYDKVLFIEFSDIESQSHGKVEDSISFKWTIVSYKSE